MSKSLNKIQIIGHTGKDAEVRYTNSGKAVASFSVATTWKSGKEERTEWHNVIAWERLAEICGEYVKKGKRVYVEGRVQSRSYDKDGEKKYITEIIATDLLLLDAPTQVAAKPVQQQSAPQQAASFDDDLPF